MAVGKLGRWIGIVLVLQVGLAVPGWTGGAVGLAQDGATATIRMVHGVAGAGALDLVVDDGVAIVGAGFPSVSDPIPLTAGEHRLRLVPSGADDALVEGTVELAAGTAYLAAALGTADEPRLFLYPIDEAPLAPGQARLRLIHGSPDLGPVDLALAGGDLVLPTVEYPNASEAADVEAAGYDLELRLAETGEVALDLPGTTLAEGRVVDLVVVGAAADGSLQALAAETTADEAPPAGRLAELRAGTCGDPGETLAEVGRLAPAAGDPVGPGSPPEAASLAGTADVPLDQLVGESTVVTVASAAGDQPAACGPVAGRFTADGALVVGLRSTAGELQGVAVLAPSAVDEAATDLSIFLVGDVGGGTGSADADAAGPEQPAAIRAIDEAGATPAP